MGIHYLLYKRITRTIWDHKFGIMCNCIRSLHLVQSLTSRKARDINHFLNIWICRWSLRLFIHWSFILLLRARLSILMEVHCRRILHRCCWKICFDRSVILYIQLFQRQWVKYSEPQRNFICHLCCFYQRSHCFWPGRKLDEKLFPFKSVIVSSTMVLVITSTVIFGGFTPIV